MFGELQFRLLMSYVIFMALIVGLFSFGIYFAFSSTLSYYANQEIDQKLKTLADVIATRLISVNGLKESTSIKAAITLVDANRDSAHSVYPNLNQVNVEWLDRNGNLIAHQGAFKLVFPPQKGMAIINYSQAKIPYQIRILTLEIYLDRSDLNQLPLEGYLRLSQSTQDSERERKQVKEILRNSLIIGNFILWILIGLGGWWLTRQSVEPVKQSLDRLKQFTADASHELRSPLMAIRASLDVIRNHPERIHPKDIQKIGAISTATEQMIHLTRDLLFLARTDITASSPQYLAEPLSLRPLLKTAIDLLEPLAQEKAIELRAQLENDGFVRGDMSQLRRLFGNLIENAIQYTPERGHITLRFTRQGQRAIVSLEDTGIGIAQDQLPYIFDRFWRGDRARSYREGGNGLGLAIAQAIAQQHGGKITVKSRVGVGSCFTVFLPLMSAERSRSTR